MGNLTALLSKIQPAVYREQTVTDQQERTSKNADFVQKVADINVRHNVPAIIQRSHVLEHLVESQEIAIIGAMHDIETGIVTFLEDTLIDDLPKFIAARNI
jgi:carbonic anhydrase